jgi:hypothetical protein
LEAAKPVFIRLKDEKTALADQLNERTEQLTAAETAFNIKLQEIQKKNDEDKDLHKKELLAVKGAGSTSSALVDNELIALKRDSAAALEKVNLENEALLKKLAAEEALKKDSFAALEKVNLENEALLKKLAAEEALEKDSVAALEKVNLENEALLKKLATQEELQKKQEALKKVSVSALEKANQENEALLKKLAAQEELQKKHLLVYFAAKTLCLNLISEKDAIEIMLLPLAHITFFNLILQ